MHGITERYLSGQKADAARFVRLLLGDLESRISTMFARFVDDACHQIERSERNVRQSVLPYIPRFATLATRMEQYIAGQSRDLVDQAYTKFVSIMFVTLEKLAQTEPKYADIFLIENYAAFQNRFVTISHAKKKLKAASIFPIPFQLGLSKVDFRKMLKASLSGMDRSIGAMYKKLQKNLTSEELLPSLWDKCKKDFVDKYDSFVQLVAKIYPAESVPTTQELKDLLANM
ncbi:Exocyst complex component S3A, variant 3 [Lathyrus oleraceus]|uniref:Exocyst complex component S3A, variant 3 n=1 Tax=Pisum sativum TaxID=3888 RepID=A0A9D4WTM6_PEA|nr:Exocyst complex component S3A, variant 3 [Pisum sativum]